MPLRLLSGRCGVATKRVILFGCHVGYNIFHYNDNNNEIFMLRRKMPKQLNSKAHVIAHRQNACIHDSILRHVHNDTLIL